MTTQRVKLLRIGVVYAALLLMTPLALGQNVTPNGTPQTLQGESEWTWKDRDGTTRTRVELDEILRAHALWLETREAGELADLCGAKLADVALSGVNLSEAALPLADLHDAELTGANLSGALLADAKLTDAVLVEVDLSNARVGGADFEGAIFEPKPSSLPYIPDFALAENLSKMQFRVSDQVDGHQAGSEAGLVELRKALKEAGLRRQEREVNYALLRCRREKMWQSPHGLGDRADAAFQYVFFEVTCKYGMLPGRPLQIMGIFALVFTIPYLLVVLRKNRRSPSDIWVGIEDESIRPNRQRTRRFRVLANVRPAGKWRGRVRLIRRAVCVALYFSILTAFRVGFREINVGNWITRMQCREYTLRATGWVRFVSGLQSLFSVYLMALWLLTYFSRPFE